VNNAPTGGRSPHFDRRGITFTIIEEEEAADFGTQSYDWPSELHYLTGEFCREDCRYKILQTIKALSERRVKVQDDCTKDFASKVQRNGLCAYGCRPVMSSGLKPSTKSLERSSTCRICHHPKPPRNSRAHPRLAQPALNGFFHSVAITISQSRPV